MQVKGNLSSIDKKRRNKRSFSNLNEYSGSENNKENIRFKFSGGMDVQDAKSAKRYKVELMSIDVLSGLYNFYLINEAGLIKLKKTNLAEYKKQFNFYVKQYLSHYKLMLDQDMDVLVDKYTKQYAAAPGMFRACILVVLNGLQTVIVNAPDFLNVCCNGRVDKIDKVLKILKSFPERLEVLIEQLPPLDSQVDFSQCIHELKAMQLEVANLPRSVDSCSR